jgi:hypothetical protein
MAGPFSQIGAYDQTNAGNRFIGIIATPAAVPIQSSTSPVGLLWCRAGANVKLVPERLSITYVSGTGVAGGMNLSQLQATGSAPGTGLPFTAFTAAVINTTVFCSKIGAGNQPQGSFGISGTLTTAGVPLMSLGMSQLTTTAATTGATGWTWDYYFYDTVILLPGTVIYPTAPAATVSLYNISWIWREVPVSD